MRTRQRRTANCKTTGRENTKLILKCGAPKEIYYAKCFEETRSKPTNSVKRNGILQWKNKCNEKLLKLPFMRGTEG